MASWTWELGMRDTRGRLVVRVFDAWHPADPTRKTGVPMLRFDKGPAGRADEAVPADDWGTVGILLGQLAALTGDPCPFIMQNDDGTFACCWAPDMTEPWACSAEGGPTKLAAVLAAIEEAADGR